MVGAVVLSPATSRRPSATAYRRAHRGRDELTAAVKLVTIGTITLEL
jgi:hypothetical protein